MSGRLRTIASHAARVTAIAEQARPAFCAAPRAAIERTTGETQIDSSRLAQEAAIAAERSDVSEELARLASHVQQFQALLTGTSEVGKETRFSAAGNAARNQHAAFENSRAMKARARNHELGARDQVRNRKTARTGAEHRMSSSEPLVFIVSGPSGSGKSTLVQKILQLPGTMLSVSCTTRPPRKTESAGKWYNFVVGNRISADG